METNKILADKIRNLQLRSRIIQVIRDFFIGRDYLEIETPLRIPAPAPESHIDAVASEEWFLHTSPELCMKRLLSAGYPSIFQICRCFRRAERGDRHLPEFTLLEWYRSGIDYLELMVECEELFSSLTLKLTGNTSLGYRGRRIQLGKSWERLRVREAFARHASVPMDRALAHGVFDEIMAFEIEPKLGWDTPVFLYDYPAALGALARLSPKDPSVAERFEIYIAGIELANAFSELTDAGEQRARFARERKDRGMRGKVIYPEAEKFLECLKFLPDSAGIALGIDRLCMIFSGETTIDRVVAFTMEEL